MASRYELRIAAMSARARRTGELAARDRASRDMTIWEAHDDGMTDYAIWQATGANDGQRMALSQVQGIVNAGIAARQARLEREVMQ